MRYLTKLTPQLRSLISKEYADTIVWKGADQEMDVDQDDDYDNEDSDDDDANHERFFKFEVSRTTEQEEGAEIYPGFEFGHRAIVTPTFPSDVMVPDTTSDTLQCRLVSGETKQGFLSARFMPYQKDSKIIKMTLNPLGLSGLLVRHQNIHLGKDVTEESLAILMKDGRLQQRAERLTNQWGSDVKTWSDNRDKEIKEGLAQVQTSIAVGRRELSLQVRIRIASMFTSIFPFLDPDRLRGPQPPSADEVNPDFWNDLFANYPAAFKAETDVVDPKKLSHISCHRYNAVKKRVLDKEDELLSCEGLSEEDRNDLFLEIIHDERKNHGIWAKLSSVASAAGKVLRGDNRPRADPSKTTDSEFMGVLDDMAQHSHMRPLIEEIYDLIYNWVNRKIDELSPRLVDKVESIQRREKETQIKEQAKLEEKKKKAEGFEVFRNALQKILLPDPNKPCLTVNSIRRGYYSFGHPTYELKGVVESEKEPCIEYTLFILELTESDRTHIQDDPRFVPRPEAYGAASFHLALQDSIR
ncbi:hypothetical protein FRC03_007130 [Tulasnella sp. 419]|nr:hypothetical protein FRC03_007130 [Tulasnella sp. 419]